MKKKRVIATLSNLPDEFELDQLVEKLFFIEKVEKGLEQVTKGETISHKQIKEDIAFGILMEQAENSRTVSYEKVIKRLKPDSK